MISLPLLKASGAFNASEKLIEEKLNPIIYKVCTGTGEPVKLWAGLLESINFSCTKMFSTAHIFV